MNRATTRSSSLRLLVVAASMVALGGTACDAPSPDDGEYREGELMFELDEEEVARIHEQYVGDGDLDMTMARLTAPFDCSLFDDFCDQVGRDAAFEITAMQVELARDEVSPEEMDETTLAWISEAMDEYEPEEDELVFRGSTNWVTRTKGDYRLRVRNGISTPMSGPREAWTQSKFQHKDWLGVWWQVQADSLCANTGLNTQEHWNGVAWMLMESKDPANACNANDGNFKKITTHARWDSGSALSYRIKVNGCGSADQGAVHFGICAPQRTEWF